MTCSLLHLIVEPFLDVGQDLAVAACALVLQPFQDRIHIAAVVGQEGFGEPQIILAALLAQLLVQVV